MYGVVVPEESKILADIRRGGAMPSAETLASAYLQQLRTTQPHGPYCLAGVSYGGLVAWEVAQQLQRAGEEVALLVMFDTILPAAVRRRPVKWFVSRVSAILKRRSIRDWRSGASRYPSPIGWLRKAGLLRKPVGGAESNTPSDSPSEESIERMRWKRFTSSMSAYEKRIQRFRGDVVVFQAKRRTGFVGYDVDLHACWRPLVDGQLDVVDVPSDHIEVLQPPFVRRVAEAIDARLARLEKR
ncbi:MAG: thioesterase domain-containing protein [Myxococcota bacterium]